MPDARRGVNGRRRVVQLQFVRCNLSAGEWVARSRLRRFNCQTAFDAGVRHRPCSLRPGVGRLPTRLSPGTSSPPENAEGTERRKAPLKSAPRKQVYAVCATHLRLAARARLCARRARPAARPAALHRGFSVPGAVLPGGAQGMPFGLPLSGQLPPPFVPAHVQPFKAAGLGAGGRVARASRVRGYEPRPRAPHQPGSGFPGPAQRPMPVLRHRRLCCSVLAASREDALSLSKARGGWTGIAAELRLYT
jgi:hypothetical protein